MRALRAAFQEEARHSLRWAPPQRVLTPFDFAQGVER